MLELPEVTLVCVETREHELARLALEDCLSKVDFGDVLILTDRPLEFASLTKFTGPGRVESAGGNGAKPRAPVRIHTVPDWPEKLGWSRSWWFDVPPLLQTRHTLNIQWDSWIWDDGMWCDEFLDYDYIGAPWWYKDGKNVGNGGFSLVSTPLKRYIYDRRDKFPCDTAVDDDLLCRKYRPQLEEAGFVWAPESVAHKFAFECCRPSPESRHFGFHAMFNWPHVLEKDRLLERVRVALKSTYIRDGYMMKELIKCHPEIVTELMETAPTTGGQ